MQLTKAGADAIRCLFYLSMKKEGETIFCDELAKETDIPIGSLIKIVKHLSRSGFLDSFEDGNGRLGIKLSKEKLNMHDIAKAVISKPFSSKNS